MYRHKWRDHDALYFNNPFGFCKLTIFQRDGLTVGCIYDLIVYPQYRKQGQGRILLNFAIDTARLSGCDVVVLWPDCEPWVEEWYRRKGFREDNSFRDYSGNIGWSLKLKMA